MALEVALAPAGIAAGMTGVGAVDRGRRDVGLEHRFLATVAEHAKHASGDFGRRVTERLDRAGELFDRDLPDHLSVGQVLAEIREEAEDVAGWSLMALHLAREHGLSEIETFRLARRLARAAAFAAMLDREVAEALVDLVAVA
jgi:hypothetical protein